MLVSRWEYFLTVSHREPSLQVTELAGLGHRKLDVVPDWELFPIQKSFLICFLALLMGKNYVNSEIILSFI
jgi:hypothetical protein